MEPDAVEPAQDGDVTPAAAATISSEPANAG
jgi:hypothetical protein